MRFRIVAKAAPDTPTDQLLRMLQTLLTERFQLAFHREQKSLAYLALVVGKKGPRLQQAQDGSDASGNSLGPGRIFSNRLSMPVLATLLSRFMRQPVLDMTGLQGWLTSGVSIFTAMQEQLGLKLEARKGPLKVIVVDHAEKIPMEN